MIHQIVLYQFGTLIRMLVCRQLLIRLHFISAGWKYGAITVTVTATPHLWHRRFWSWIVTHHVCCRSPTHLAACRFFVLDTPPHSRETPCNHCFGACSLMEGVLMDCIGSRASTTGVGNRCMLKGVRNNCARSRSMLEGVFM